ncbi:hypothetical protein CNEO4_370039 [Clostridium neonatale]|nr:hypothetical protein CNEO4_330019 [Clostridium neonatale]CAI3653602.1 hypothetical protein CNEO4_370039 [Clostridium neonatale]
MLILIGIPMDFISKFNDNLNTSHVNLNHFLPPRLYLPIQFKYISC